MSEYSRHSIAIDAFRTLFSTGETNIEANHALKVDISVVTVMTNVFQKSGIVVSRRLAKITRIFVDMGHILN